MLKALVPAALAAWVFAGTARADVPAVAVDIAPLHSLVAQVMGDLGTPELVVSPGASPHGYSMRPSEAGALQDADIIFWMGANLTPWLASAIETLATDAEQVPLLDVPGTTVLAQRESPVFEKHEHAADEHEDGEHEDGEHEKGEHEKGEHHETEQHDGRHAGAYDPHAWLDPSNASRWLDTIAAVLSRQDPEHAQTYTANAATGKTRLDELTTDIEAILEPVRDRNFIVFHDAYQYFENAFEFPASGAISISDATRPGPARLRQIHERVADASVTCVLAEPQFNPDLIDTVLDGTDARSAALDPLGSHVETGPGLYPQLLRELARTLADCL